MQIRCSSLPRVVKCPMSALDDGPSCDTTGEGAVIGQAVHAALAEIALRDAPETHVQAALTASAAAHGVEPSEMASLVYAGLRALQDDVLVRGVTEIQTEVEVKAVCNDVEFTGHIDLLGNLPDGGTFIADWKTGGYAPCAAQVLAYAALAVKIKYDASADGLPGRAMTVTYWLREGQADEVEYDVQGAIDGLCSIADRIRTGIENQDHVPGSHCVYCPRRGRCTAAADSMTSDLALFRAGAGDLSDPANVSRLADALQSVRQIETACRRFKDTVKEQIKAGPLQTDRGTVLRIEEKIRESVDPKAAWPILTSGRFTPDELAEIVSVRKGELLQAAANAVPPGSPRGAKGEAKKDLEAELREIGALVPTVMESIVEESV